MAVSVYPKRLIEVDLPIKRISGHARREKSIRQGHIKSLHIWWARRPLAACRAVICASLWIDPVDENCPPAFRQAAAREMNAFAKKAVADRKLAESCSQDAFGYWMALSKPEGAIDATKSNHRNVLRSALLFFIGDFANWDNSIVPAYLETARALTQAAHEALGGAPGTRPLVVDPFAGGGTIPLEALRVGADAFASDLNPIAVLLNKVILEYLPKYKLRLSDEVRKWGEWVKKESEKELAEYYPNDSDGATPIAYLWARTITCEGPNCGAQVPMIKKYGITERDGCSSLVPEIDKKKKTITFTIYHGKKVHPLHWNGNLKRGKVTCQVCDWTMSGKSIQKQLSTRDGGANDARHLATITRNSQTGERIVRLPSKADRQAAERATSYYSVHTKDLQLPIDEFPIMSGVFNAPLYGMNQWYKLFTKRQLVALNVFFSKVQIVQEVAKLPNELARAVMTCLGLAIGNMAHYNTSVSTYTLDHMLSTFIQGQAIPMKWDFAETNPLMPSLVGGFDYALEQVLSALTGVATEVSGIAQVEQANAVEHPLPDDSADLWFTDPPYYNSVPYADLSDFFLVWFSRFLNKVHPDLLTQFTSPKKEELCEMAGWDPRRYAARDRVFYEHGIRDAFQKSLQICKPTGIGAVVFAHKSTEGWEALLQALIDAGWICTSSWPIDTENTNRMRAHGSATLSSSVHIICRPRENPDGTERTDDVGDWRDILSAMPKRIHDWMPRLAQEGVVGADAIFACLGPALEIFSRYSRVEKASGELVTLKEYLEYVWAAVSKEALNLIFKDADATGFEEDARLTAMWLWTLTTNAGGENGEPEEDEADDDEESGSGSASAGGYVLEYDTARKIAQGLGAHLERLTGVVSIKGDKARLLPVGERKKFLFGKQELEQPAPKKRKAQMTLPGMVQEAQGEYEVWGDLSVFTPGTTTLDRVHQSMILFAAGRSEALKRFLQENGIGSDQRFWRLAQALSALYPSSSDEKRWVDGVLARKKGLGY